MNSCQFNQIIYCYRDDLTEKVKQALYNKDYKKAAELNSPSHIIHSYVYGIQDIAKHYNNNIPRFIQSANGLIQYMNQWAKEVEGIYYDFHDIVKNPEFSVTIDDVFKVYKYSTDFSMLDFAKDLLKTISNNFINARGDIRVASRYYESLNTFEDEVQMKFGRKLYNDLLDDIN